MATLKKETIQITLEKGSGTILVTRPDNTGKTIGLIHQFTAEVVCALAQAAEGKLETWCSG